MASAVYESRSRLHQRCRGKRHRGGQLLRDDGTHARLACRTMSVATKWGSGTPDGRQRHLLLHHGLRLVSQREAAWQGGLALWSAVANIKFAEAADATSANFVITRGNDGAFARFPDQDLSVIGAGTLAAPASTGSLISMDTNALDFGPIGQDLEARGGFPLSTVVHEIGHIIGLGHGGLYNGDVNADGIPVQPLRHKLWTTCLTSRPCSSRRSSSISTLSPAPTGDRTSTPDGTGPRAAHADGARHPGGPAALRRGDQRSAGNPAARSSASTPTSRAISAGSTISPSTSIRSSRCGAAARGNTLDLSGFSSDSTINLAPGTFSSAAGLTNNIGIAFGTVIETAIGGGGNDTLLGNDLHNILREVPATTSSAAASETTACGATAATTAELAASAPTSSTRAQAPTTSATGWSTSTATDFGLRACHHRRHHGLADRPRRAHGDGVRQHDGDRRRRPVLRPERPLLGRRFHDRGARQRRQMRTPW